MTRERLTRRASAEGAKPDHKTDYPGTVNQPDRKFPENDKYDNYKETVESHDLQDMKTDWKNDKHDEMGFGVPEAWGKKSASIKEIRVAASKAVKVAVWLLGDKADEKVIEAQAKDFLAMGPNALARTIDRFASTESLYASAQEPVKNEADATKCACMTAAPAPEAVPAAPAAPAVAPVVPAEDKTVPAIAAAPAPEAAPAPAKDEGDFDVSMDADEGDDKSAEGDDSDALSELFGGKDSELGKEGKQASSKSSDEKKGIKSLGGQPRIASSGDEEDLVGIWKSEPDVSTVFR